LYVFVILFCYVLCGSQKFKFKLVEEVVVIDDNPASAPKEHADTRQRVSLREKRNKHFFENNESVEEDKAEVEGETRRKLLRKGAV